MEAQFLKSAVQLAVRAQYPERKKLVKNMKPEGEADDFWFSYRPESSKEKMWRKCKENPFVPFGLAGTVAALTYGLISFQRGNSRTQQHMMRLRVVAQGFTVISVVLGVAIMQWRKPAKDTKNKPSTS